jgi:two-component system phosphate regulon sensor histidine kinase PhoR
MATIEPRYRKRLFSATIMLSAPALVALALLAGFDRLSVAGMLFGAAAVLAGTGFGLALHFRHMAGLERYIRWLRGTKLEERELPDPPGQGSGFLAPGLREALGDTAHERQRRRRELTAAIEGSEAVLNALPDPLLLLDDNRRIVRANPPARALYGERIAGRDLTAVTRHPSLLEAVDAVLESARKTARGAAGEESGKARLVEFVLPGDMERFFSAQVTPLPKPTPEGTTVLVALHELTGMKRAEQMRADFVANASHELRTPLSSLLGFIETLRGAAREDEAARERFLAIMLEQAQRMSRLIEDLLSLSRIELDEHSPPRETCDLGRVLESAVGALGPQADAKDITIDLDVGHLGEAVGDRDQLAQVFQNLIDNAIKYGRTGSTVQVVARPAAQRGGRAARQVGPDGIAVSVIDQGEGIARAHLTRLTERFYRVDAARSRELGGTGLGLAIVKHIVNRHRGQLEIESEPGQGSTFTVYLPGRPAEGAQRKRGEAAE